MKFWFAYSHRPEIYGEEMLFLFLANNMNLQSGNSIGLIASKEDKKFLESFGCRYKEFIEADLTGKNGALIKIEAIQKFLPDGDALIDGDVFLSKKLNLNPSYAWVLNYEPLYFFKKYNDDYLKQCVPTGNRTINAGLLYAPKDHFREYARQAEHLAKQEKCIGHTYEQMFFLKYCQDKNIEIFAIYPKEVHLKSEVEIMWQESGVRHPFCYKCSLIETQRCIQIAMKFGNKEDIKKFIIQKRPYYKTMI
jgi:hypothetical protein